MLYTRSIRRHPTRRRSTRGALRPSNRYPRGLPVARAVAAADAARALLQGGAGGALQLGGLGAADEDGLDGGFAGGAGRDAGGPD